jgi:putative ABC transport system permease protein
MIAHLLRLAWNRKRSNALVILEIGAAFLVVAAVVTFSVQLGRNWLRPLGFSSTDVWSVHVDRGTDRDARQAADGAGLEAFRHMLTEVRAIDGIVGACGAFSAPYDTSVSAGVWNHEGRDVYLEFDEVTDECSDVLGLSLTRGRWFSPSDSALAFRPVVIDEDLAHDWFGSADPLGQTIPLDDREPPTRVVGLVTDFRKGGELSGRSGFVFTRIDLTNPTSSVPRNLVLKVRPGLDARFEQALLERLQAVNPGYSLELHRLDQMRETSLRERLAPLGIGAVVAAFLLLMVGLGLLGVLWQNVTRRTREIGLRRAIGASRAGIRRQMLLEVALTTTLGLALGTVLIVQVPMLDLLPFLDHQAFVWGVALSAGIVYLLTLACGVYPGLLAARIQPARALHEE